MNKRIKKKHQKRLNESLRLGFDSILSYNHIKAIKKVYHEFDLILARNKSVFSDSKELGECACCGKMVEKGKMYFEKGFFDNPEFVNGQYVYTGYMVCEECHSNGK